MNDQPRQSDSAHKPRQPFVEVLLLVLVFFVIGGEPAPHDNEAHYLCRLKHFWNPDWCRGDLFLESSDAQVAFIWTFGWVTRWLSLPATAWVGRLLAWTLLAWAWQRLSWRLAPRSWASLVSGALFVTLNGMAQLAGEWVVGGVEGKCFAFVCVLLALRELVEERWGRLCWWLGAAIAFHPLVGGWSAVVCGGIWLLSRAQSVRITNWGFADAVSALPGTAAGGMLALVGIVPALGLSWGQPAEVVGEANRIYVFERLAHHLALFVLPQDELIGRLLRHGALLSTMAFFTFALRRSSGIAISNPSAAPIDFSGVRRLILFAWGGVLLAAIGFGIELLFWHDPLAASRWLRYYWFRLTDFAAPLAVSLAAVSLVYAALDMRRMWAAWGLAAVIALTGWHLSARAFARLANPIPPTDRRMADFGAWLDVCGWIQRHTEADALFLTPAANQTFKWRTGRPEVVTRKDIPQDAASIVEWFRRYRGIHFVNSAVDGVAAPVASLADLGTERVQEIAEQYGARYVVTDAHRPLALTMVYPTQQHSNPEYVVYRIPERARADRGNHDGD
jgi:hypothetical protein